MPGPMAGIKIVGLVTYVAVPSACAILGDWGADVIKIEQPPLGEPQRRWTPQSAQLPPCPVNPTMELDHRNQRSLAVDVSKKQGKEIIYRLVKGADVFLSNLQEPSLKRLAMDYDTMSQLNPRLIYLHFSGFGDLGPDAEKPGYDHSGFWAASGIGSILGEPENPLPRQAAAMGDHTSSLAVAGGVAAALFARERFGFGQKIETSLMAVGMWVNAASIVSSLYSGQEVKRTSRKDLANPMRGIFRCRDDHWIQVIMPVEPDRFWPAFCRAMGIEHLEHDPKFENEMARARNCQELNSILDDIFASKNFTEWKKILDDYKLVWAKMNTPKDITESPQAAANEFIREIRHPVLGTARTIASPVKFSKTPISLRMPGPAVGEHTEEVLREIGYTADNIVQLRQEGIIL